MARIVIAVYRGTVTSVYSDDESIEVEVIDHDEIDRSENSDILYVEAQRKTLGLRTIW